jgi:FKBP-type peptidyl-prolyl cis-trans isomerase
MKKILCLLVFIASFAGAEAQVTKNTTPVVKPKNLLDSASYAIGVSVASYYKQQGFTKINNAMLTKAINDIFSGKQAIIDENTCTNILNKYAMSLQESKSKPNIQAGEAFLKQNKTRKEVVTTASGMQYEVIVQGTGPKLAAIDTFVAHYKGTLLDGTEIDNSYKRGTPLVYAVSDVVKGWQEGLQLMPVGSKYKFYIPSNLGYGPYDNGPIPGGSLLVFEVELLDMKKGKEGKKVLKDND